MTLDGFQAVFTAPEWDLFVQCVDNQNPYFFLPYHRIFMMKRYVDRDDYATMLDAAFLNNVMDATRYATMMTFQPAVGETQVISGGTNL